MSIELVLFFVVVGGALVVLGWALGGLHSRLFGFMSWKRAQRPPPTAP